MSIVIFYYLLGLCAVAASLILFFSPLIPCIWTKIEAKRENVWAQFQCDFYCYVSFVMTYWRECMRDWRQCFCILHIFIHSRCPPPSSFSLLNRNSATSERARSIFIRFKLQWRDIGDVGSADRLRLRLAKRSIHGRMQICKLKWNNVRIVPMNSNRINWHPTIAFTFILHIPSPLLLLLFMWSFVASASAYCLFLRF